MSRLPFDPDKVHVPASERADGAGSSRAEERGGGGGSKGQPLTVSQLAGQIKRVLSDGFARPVRVVGEVSNLSSRHHWFFSLKDSDAALRCVCFASNARRLSIPIEDGMQVVATGRIDFYDAQGNVQLYVTGIEPVGQGALELKLRQLIEQLRGQGYFDEAHKRALPVFPRRVAVVSSRAGAALQDVIETARRRWAGCELLVYDVPVQGEQAAGRIARAIRLLSEGGAKLGIDVILLTRGGGSIEDLWAFNERELADALYACSLPVVAAIGHETDVTVAELVADARASTPTQAVMRLIPEAGALEQQLGHLAGRLNQTIHRQMRHDRQRLRACERRALFLRPGALIGQHRQHLDALSDRVKRCLPQRVFPENQRLNSLVVRLHRALPRRQQSALQAVEASHDRLERAMKHRLEQQRQQLENRASHLEAVSPRRVLKRGYSYTLGPDGHLLQHPQQVRVGDVLTTVLAEGRVQSRVDDSMGDTKKQDRAAAKPASGKAAKPGGKQARAGRAEQGELF